MWRCGPGIKLVIPFKKSPICMVDTDGFQRFAGSTERAPDAGLTLMLHSGRASQVNSLGARAQSCICWTSEAQAAAGAREPILEICW